MDAFLGYLESSALSEWVRSESILAFPAIVTLHTIGMGFLAGSSAAIDLRILGFAPGIPLKVMARFLPLLWLAFAVNAISGILLLIGYPTKALTNPVFYTKLGLIALAIALVYWISATVLRAGDADHRQVVAKAKVLALASLAAWVAVIVAGRLLAYTRRWELLGIPAIT